MAQLKALTKPFLSACVPEKVWKSLKIEAMKPAAAVISQEQRPFLPLA